MHPELIASVNLTGSTVDTKLLFERVLSTGITKLRFNLARLQRDKLTARLENAKAVISSLGFDDTVQMLLDIPIPGAKIRLGSFPEHSARLRTNQEVSFRSAHASDGCDLFIPVRRDKVGTLVTKGDRLICGDGEGVLCVSDVTGDDTFRAVSLNAFTIYEHAGIHCDAIPKAVASHNYIDDIVSTIACAAPAYVALSFVETGSQVSAIRDALVRHCIPAQIVSKVETPDGVRNAEAIAEASDVVMIARGDIGVTVPIESIWIAQAETIKKTKALGRRVFVATHVAESLRFRAIPCASEVVDIAQMLDNRVDGVVLSPGLCSSEGFEGKYQVLQRLMHMRTGSLPAS